MPSVVAPNVVGRREWFMNMIFVADNRSTVFTSMARKPKSSITDEKTGIPNSQIGSYQAKVYGALKAGGVADGVDVTAFDVEPVRELINFRPEKYRRTPMVGDLAKDDVIAGLDKGEWNEAVASEMTMHARDIEAEMLSIQDSSSNGGALGGTTTRGIGNWVNDGTIAWLELPVPGGSKTPSAQIYASTLGSDITSGLTEAVVKGLFQARWDSTGSTNKLTGFLGADIKNRFADFTKYKPSVSNATVIVRTQTLEFTSGELAEEAVDLYMSEWGSCALMAVNTIFLPTSKYGYILDMDQVEIRSRYWMREKPLPDLGGGPREEIASFVALIPGDLRSHIKIAAT